MTDKESIYNRYQRQMIMPGFGVADQQKLLNARVLVVGAGGLGCPVLMVLAGAGVGHIGIVDDGFVELSNLHRQFLYKVDDIGKLKVECAAQTLHRMNPEIDIKAFPIQLTATNAWDILVDYDIVIDGTDNFHTRYMLNDACALMKKTLVYGAVSRYEGQVAVFNHSITYRDIFPEPPLESEVANCNEAGVLGVLPGIIGHYMANECIKLIRQTGDVLTGKLMTYSANDNRSFIVELTSTSEGRSAIPKSRIEFEQTNYPALCGVNRKSENEIDHLTLKKMMEKEKVMLVDVREWQEMPVIKNLAHLKIPLSELARQADTIEGNTVVFICQSGKRSLKAIEIYRNEGANPHAKLYSLKGGVNMLNLTGVID